MQIRKAQDWLDSTFDSYLSLQNESFEFIIRSADIHKWLQEAYQFWQSAPSLNAAALYSSWSEAFKHVYAHLFAVLLRPYRLIVLALGELPKFPPPASSPQTPMDIYLDFIKVWSEAQSRFFAGFLTAFQRDGHGSPGLPNRTDGYAQECALETSPLSLLKEISDEEVNAYVGTLERFCGTCGEDQFLFPKPLILKIQEVCSDYPKLCSLSRRYETLFYNTWEKSLRRFTLTVTVTSQPIQFKTFFNRYMGILEEEYDLLLQSEQFITVQNDFTRLTSKLIESMRKVVELRLTMSPFLPFPTRSEIEAFEKSMIGYRRKISLLEKKVMEIEDQLDALNSAKLNSNKKLKKAVQYETQLSRSTHDDRPERKVD